MVDSEGFEGAPSRAKAPLRALTNSLTKFFGAVVGDTSVVPIRDHRRTKTSSDRMFLVGRLRSYSWHLRWRCASRCSTVRTTWRTAVWRSGTACVRRCRPTAAGPRRCRHDGRRCRPAPSARPTGAPVREWRHQSWIRNRSVSGSNVCAPVSSRLTPRTRRPVSAPYRAFSRAGPMGRPNTCAYGDLRRSRRGFPY